MKKLFRMFIFCSLALYFTSLWNKGFILKYDARNFLLSVIVVILLYYLAIPLTKLILLPLNILTLGLVSVIAYFLLFYFVISHVPLLKIEGWDFKGVTLFGITISKMKIGYLANLIVSALSLSFIINTLESIL